jgi:hypothetical protein
MNDSLRFGQLAGSMAAAAGAMLVLVLWRRRVRLTRGVAVVLATLCATLTVTAHYLFDLPALFCIGLLLTPLWVWIGRALASIRAFRDAPRLRAVVRLAGVALPLGALLAISAVRFAKTQSQDGEYDPYSSGAGFISTPHAQRAI